jgi:hypothetical protein
MTLILTMVSPIGIAHISDSNLSDRSMRTLPKPGAKVFASEPLHAGVAYAGTYSVNGVSMDKWMPGRIREYERDASGTVAGLARWLRLSLDKCMTAEEKQSRCFVHVAGYLHEEGRWHPVVYVISNVIDVIHDGECQGEYLPAQPSYRPLVEEFWSDAEKRAQFEAGMVITYVNGFAPGRMAYMKLLDGMQELFHWIWNRGWKFRPPRNLEELATYVRLHLSIVSSLFEISDYPGRIIGGEPQIKLTAPP